MSITIPCRDTNVPMNVNELMDALRQIPGDALVITEGCDCDGRVEEVEFIPKNYDGAPTVYLKRARS